MSSHFTKEYAGMLYREAARLDVKTITVFPEDNMGVGLTIAYCPATKAYDCRMYRVAVSYCAPEDEFFAKEGRLQALNKMFLGEFIQLPLAETARTSGTTHVRLVLTQMFALFQ